MLLKNKNSSLSVFYIDRELNNVLYSLVCSWVFASHSLMSCCISRKLEERK